jgi:hypothetical protein
MYYLLAYLYQLDSDDNTARSALINMSDGMAGWPCARSSRRLINWMWGTRKRAKPRASGSVPAIDHRHQGRSRTIPEPGWRIRGARPRSDRRVPKSPTVFFAASGSGGRLRTVHERASVVKFNFVDCLLGDAVSVAARRKTRRRRAVPGRYGILPARRDLLTEGVFARYLMNTAAG